LGAVPTPAGCRILGEGPATARNIGQPDFETDLYVRPTLADETNVFEWPEQVISHVRTVLTEFESDFDRAVGQEFRGVPQVLQKTPR